MTSGIESKVISIVHRPRDAATPRPQDHFARVQLARALMVEFQGIDGDAKGGSTDRQLNVMLAEQLAELAAEGFKTGPGELGEQLILEGIDPAALVAGARLKIGAAVIEVGIPRTGCARFEAIQSKPKQLARGRLGVMAKVVAGGVVAVGDGVEFLPA